MRHGYVTVPIVWLSLAAGCATPTTKECDPTTGGFFGGVRCHGTYEAREKEKKEELAQVQAARRSNILELQAAEAERRTIAEEKSAREAERAAASRTLAELERQLATSLSGNAELESQAKQLRAQMNAVDQELPGLSEAEKQKAARIEQLRQERDALEKEAEAYSSD